MTPLTPKAIDSIVAPLVLLPNAPALDAQLYAVLLALFASEGITCEELAAAVIVVLKTERFWPSPCVIVETVVKSRNRLYLANQDAERIHRKRIAESDPDAYENMRHRLGGALPPETARRGGGPKRII